MIAGFFILGLGCLLTFNGWQHWRLRKQETISLLEAAILRTTGVEPSPRTRIDRLFTWVHAGLSLIMGPVFIVVGIYGLLSEAALI